MLLHESEFLWNNIHRFHHQYKEPSACVEAPWQASARLRSPSLPSPPHPPASPPPNSLTPPPWLRSFAQFAVHPIEAALQGPVGHFCVQLWFPVHPVQLAVMGFLSSAWAFAAHDGRGGDFNSHYFHHSKGRGRSAYFNLGFLTPFWDVVMGTRWSEAHPLWVQWKAAERAGKGYDTSDGTAAGAPNSVYLSEGKLAEERVEHAAAKGAKGAKGVKSQ